MGQAEVTTKLIALLVEELESGVLTLPTECEVFNAYEWANTLESLTHEQRLKVWPKINAELTSSILSEMREDARNQLISGLSLKDLFNTVSTAANSEVIEILEVLPQKSADKLVNRLSPETQSHIETSLSFSADQVGRYANPNVFTINKMANVGPVLNEIATLEEVNSSGLYLVVDENNTLVGEVTINELLNQNISKPITSVLKDTFPVINAETGLLDASNLVRSSNRNLLPVVTSSNRLIGVYSMQDALNVFHNYYEAQVAHLGRVSDEDLFAPILVSARKRAIWLGINLLTAFLASMVIGIFDKVLVEVVALAVLMPIVASMGGITGSQTLTLSIRGLATGQLNKGNFKVLRSKELAVSLINGVLWAVVVAVFVSWWFDNYYLSAILAVALVINMSVAALSGIIIPLTLNRFGVDPALAGSVILTTVTDVVGFFIFLGGATLLFIN